MNNHSYITAALEAISSYKNRDGDITNFAMRVGEETNSPTLLNAILVAHERTIDASTDHKFNGGPAPLCAPIAFLDYVQGIMNKVSGLARRDMLGKREPEYGNGIDFSQELTDQVGFSVDPSHIAELVDEDFYVLNNLHCYVAQAMPYLTDIAPLHYHAESVKLLIRSTSLPAPNTVPKVQNVPSKRKPHNFSPQPPSLRVRWFFYE
jgi:hypothetical protein